MSKTPVTQLQELCMKRKHGPPIYNLTTDGSSDPANPAKGGGLFVYEVEAFGQLAAGQGKNKRDAKHEAAINIIAVLQQLPEFAAELAHISLTVPARSSLADIGADAVGTLLDICVSRDWPIATFTVQQAYGTAHAPEFRVECRVASMVRIGTSSTKKRAKQIAALEMLRVIQSLPMDEHEMQIATLREELPEKHVKTYRELRKSDIKNHTGTKLCDRHKFFERMEPADREKWRQIFYFINETALEKVHMLCRVMSWKAVVTPVKEHPDGRMKLFELHGCNYDVMLAGPVPELYDEVLEYFREMSGVQREVPVQ